jgi:hypothetical protein
LLKLRVDVLTGDLCPVEYVVGIEDLLQQRHDELPHPQLVPLVTVGHEDAHEEPSS